MFNTVTNNYPRLTIFPILNVEMLKESPLKLEEKKVIVITAMLSHYLKFLNTEIWHETEWDISDRRLISVFSPKLKRCAWYKRSSKQSVASLITSIKRKYGFKYSIYSSKNTTYLGIKSIAVYARRRWRKL